MLKHLLVFAAVSMGTPVMAANKVTCEGTLEHGSGGEYIREKPQCWQGSVRSKTQCWLFANLSNIAKLPALLPRVKRIVIPTYVWKSSSYIQSVVKRQNTTASGALSPSCRSV
jgi:hypothetical protein